MNTDTYTSSFLFIHFPYIFGISLSIITGIIRYYKNKKPKLVYYSNGHGFESFNVNNKKIIQSGDLKHLYMNSIILFNSSKTTIRNIEVYLSNYIFNSKINETCLSIYPEYEHSVKDQENVKIIKFPYLSPKDEIKLSFLSTYPYTSNVFIQKIRSENGVAKPITTMTYEKPTIIFIIFVNTFLYIGLLTTLIIIAKFFLLPLFKYFVSIY